MAITTYATLKSRAQAWLKPNTQLETPEVALIADYVSLAESHFNMTLMHPRMKAIASLTFTSGVAAVPSGLLNVEYIGLTQDPFTELFPKNVDPIAVSSGYNGGAPPSGYEWIGENFVLDTPATVTASIRYRPALTPLSDAAPSNWLLEQFPSLYLFRTILEGDTRYMDTEQLGVVNARYEQAKREFDDMVRFQHFGRIQISSSSRGVA